MDDTVTRPDESRDLAANPLGNWSNDDLMLTQAARLKVFEAWPRAYRVLDWAELRQRFVHHDAAANLAKSKINRHGVTGAFLSAVGASLLALVSLLPAGSFQNGVIVVGCGFVSFGGILGVWHLLGHSGRAKWLVGRLWTERLRQFHFQFLINNLDAAIAAMGDDAKHDAYQASRNGALNVFIDDIEKNLNARSFSEAICWLADDHDNSRAWAQGGWQVNRVTPGTLTTDNHRELMECLSLGRIGIQEVYARLNLKPGSSSQGNLARLVMLRGNIATFVFVVSLTLAGLRILMGGEPAGPSPDMLIALSGIAAAWGLYFRLVDQGMGYSLDAERYKLYFEQVGHVRQRFDAAGDDVHKKISALRELEIYAYAEMRQFLRAHLRSRFLG